MGKKPDKKPKRSKKGKPAESKADHAASPPNSPASLPSAPPASVPAIDENEAPTRPAKKRKLDGATPAKAPDQFVLVTTADTKQNEDEDDSSKKRCANFENCGNYLKAQTYPGPNNSRLCSPCGQRYYYRATKSKRADGEVGDTWKTPPAPKRQGKPCENFQNCATLLQTETYPGPNNSRLCPPCGHRYSYSKDKATGRAAVDGAWRTLPPTKQRGSPCENFDYCGNLLETQTRPGPNNSRLCNLCGNRYAVAIKKASGEREVDDSWRPPGRTVARDPRAPRREKQTNEDGKEIREECENFKNCWNYLGKPKYALPDGSWLCNTCAGRYRKAMKRANGAVPNNTAWRIPHQWQYASNFGQGGDGEGEEGQFGGEQDDEPPAESGQDEGGQDEGGQDEGGQDEGGQGKDGRDRSEQGGHGHGGDTSGGDGPRCRVCGSKCVRCARLSGPRKPCKTCLRLLDPDLGDVDGLCEHCVQRKQADATARPNIHAIHAGKGGEMAFARLREIAHREWRRLHPTDPFLHEQRLPTGRNFWDLTWNEIIAELRCREIVYPHKAKSLMINVLQRDDAWNGILPTHRAVASGLHDLSYGDLRRRANEAGFPSQTRTESTENLIEFLRSKRDVDDEVISIPHDRLSIIRSAVSNVAARLRKQAGQTQANQIQAGQTDDVTHRTFNHGLVGTSRAIGRLHTALENGHSPAWTSGVGFLCGPNALAMSINAVRRTYYGKTHAAVYENPVTREMLMALLFQNSADSGERGAVGIPTQAYQAYLDQRLGHLDDATRGYEYMNMTRLNNMDIDQLVAMVVLAHRANIIEMEFSVAYVRGSATDDDGNVIPAIAQIAHAGDENAPSVFLHHNMAASFDDYSHWEGFDAVTVDTDRQVVFEWGLSTPLSRDSLKPRFDSA